MIDATLTVFRSSEHTANLFAALAKAAKKITDVPKDATNAYFGYKYASDYAITTATRTPLTDNGITFLIAPTGLPEVQEFGEKSGKGGESRTLGALMFPFQVRINHESGEWIEFPFFGASSADKEDKAYYGAITGAIKYVLTCMMQLARGDDPETGTNNEPTHSTRRQKSSVGGGGSVERWRSIAPEWAHDLNANIMCTKCGTVHKVGKIAQQRAVTDKHGGGYKCPEEKCGKWSNIALAPDAPPPPGDDDDPDNELGF